MRNNRTVRHERQTPARHVSFAGRRAGIVLADEAVGRATQYLQTMMLRHFWPLARAYWFDALLAIAVVVGLVEVVLTQDVRDGPTGPLWFDVLALLGMMLPLFARRRFPFGAPVASGVVFAASSFVDELLTPHGVIPFLTAITVFVLFGLLRDRRQAIAGLGIGIGVTAIIFRNDPKGGDARGFAITCVVFSVAWMIAFVLGRKFQEAAEARERLAQAEHERAEQARFAVADERTRIARELHDVVGHSVSVMTVQAAAARTLLRPHQEKEREALLVVEQTGREALAEMRRMVGVLRRPEEAPALAPQPSLEHLDRLIAHAREAGLPVELRVEGNPEPLAASVDLTAYRLVQEGLTNAIKHARARHAEVVVRYGDGHVEISVVDDGTGDGGGVSGGHGLLGMRERVSVYGGELDAGPLPAGGYCLHARLPIS